MHKPNYYGVNDRPRIRKDLNDSEAQVVLPHSKLEGRRIKRKFSQLCSVAALLRLEDLKFVRVRSVRIRSDQHEKIV